MTSVNTNSSATTALRTLQATNKTLDMTQSRIATGLKIGEAKDNAAYWAISTTLKSDNKSLATVKDALGLGAATVDTAYQGLNNAKDILDEIKAKLTAATQAGVDRNVIQTEIKALQDQLKSIASSSNFSGENWLSVNSAASNYDSTKEVVASFSRDSSNSVSIGTISIDISKVALFDTNTTTGTRGILDTATGLVSTDGRTLGIGGAASTTGNTALNGLAGAVGAASGVNATAGVAVFTGTFAALNAASNFVDSDDAVTFTFGTDAGTGLTVSISKADATLANGASVVGEVNSATELANIFNKKVTTQGVEAFVNSAGNLAIRRSVAGLSYTVAATSVAAVDGAATAGFASRAGYSATPAVTAQQAGANATTADIQSGNFGTSFTLDADDQISFLVKTGSNAPKAVVINKALINDALNVTTGTVATQANYATVLQAALTKAGVDATVATSAGGYKFSSASSGASASLAISETSAVAGAATLSVASIDISDAGLTGVNARTSDQISKVLSAYISVVNSAINKITTAAASLGSVSSRIDLQKSFVDTLTDTIDKGVGNLIDADITEESTRLQALQTKQQLGIQALSIANSSTQNILRLFQ